MGFDEFGRLPHSNLPEQECLVAGHTADAPTHFDRRVFRVFGQFEDVELDIGEFEVSVEAQPGRLLYAFK